MYGKEDWIEVALWASPGEPAPEDEEEGVDLADEDDDDGTSFPGPEVEEDPTKAG
jgi:hypothetical protein